MDIKEPTQPNKEIPSIRTTESTEPVSIERPLIKPPKEVFIRTMQRDVAALGGKPLPPLKFKIKPRRLATEQRKVPPPAGLPVVKPGQGLEPPSAQPVPQPIPRPIPTSIPILEPKPAPSKLDIAKLIPSLSFLSLGWLMDKLKGPKDRLRYTLIILVGILIIVSIGGFFYWWEYVREVTPPTPTSHLECQDFQCLSFEGEGTDQCQADDDCLPPEPRIPESLIEVDEIETIEINIGDEDLLLNKLKSIALKTQTEGTFKRVLVKLVSQTEKKYADLETLLTALDLTFPDSILQAIAPSDVQGGNHTLFFYSQAEGNRLGILMPLKEDSLELTLKLWESAMVDDLRPLHLAVVDKIAATDVFLDNIRNNVAIRYVNFPLPDLSIDYAIIEDKLAITTSRESTYTVIDTLVPTSTEATTTEEIITTEATTTEATTTEATTTEVLE